MHGIVGSGEFDDILFPFWQWGRIRLAGSKLRQGSPWKSGFGTCANGCTVLASLGSDTTQRGGVTFEAAGALLGLGGLNSSYVVAIAVIRLGSRTG